MVTFTTSNVVTEMTPNCGIKEVIVSTPVGTTAISGDAVSFTLSDYGISATGLLTVDGYTQTTTNSIVVTEVPTTSVIAGVITISSGAGTGIKIFRVLGRSA